jgi:hypothetical protein
VRRRPARGAFVAALALLGVLTPLVSEGQPASEYEVKGAFIARFASFIEWPTDTFQEPTSPLTVCVAGKSAFDSGLAATINSSRVGERPLRAERHTPTSRCHILFVAASDQKNMAAILPTLGDATVTVGEQARFLETGGAIEFRADGNRLQFDVNLPVIERAKYRISSKLLVLARPTGAATSRK